MGGFGFGGASGFTNSIAGYNGELTINQLVSSNFSIAGKTGWGILKNGNAYFFNVTASGNVTASAVIVDGATGGVFVYSGVPALGNLIGSWAGASGIDSVGNAYPAGLNVALGAIAGSTISGSKITLQGANGEILVYSGAPALGNLIIALAGAAGADSLGNSFSEGLTVGAPGTNKQVVLGINGGSPLIYFLSGIATAFNNAAFMVNVSGSGVTASDVLVLKSSQDNAFKDYVAINLEGNSNDGTTQQATLAEAYVDTAGTAHFYRLMTWAGNTIVGAVFATQPGTGTGRGNVAVQETWHAMSLTSSFTTNAGDQAPRYRLEGVGGGVCRLDGVPYTVNASTPSGTVIATLPVGYRPTQRKRYGAVTNYSGYTGGSPGGTLFIVNTNGTITTSAASTAAANQLVFDGVTFPVD